MNSNDLFTACENVTDAFSLERNRAQAIEHKSSLLFYVCPSACIPYHTRSHKEGSINIFTLIWVQLNIHVAIISLWCVWFPFFMVFLIRCLCVWHSVSGKATANKSLHRLIKKKTYGWYFVVKRKSLGILWNISNESTWNEWMTCGNRKMNKL